MKLSEYQELYRKLSTPGDIDFLAENFGYDKEFLLVIYNQRVTRDTMKSFYRVKAQAGRLAYEWNRGEPFLSIANRYRFPPVLLAQMILEYQGMNRKQFWKHLGDLATAPDARLRKELKDVMDNDLIYSPAGTEIQYARGRWGEARLKTWLEERGVQYRTESQIRGEFEKTPDALLKTPLKWEGSTYYWIESKAIVGDPYEVKRHIKKQLVPYTQLFGDGVVVYWFGYVEDGDIGLPDGITMMDSEAFERFRPTVSAPLPEDFHRPDRAKADASAS